MSRLASLVKTVFADSSGASKITDRYRTRTPKSAALFARAVQHEPYGVSRQVSHWSPYPLTMSGGEGCFLHDVDGHRYFDLLGNFTALVHGNAYPPIQEALRRALPRGTVWAANNEAQLSLAEQLVQRIPGVEQLRFTNSGTEAGNLALLIARAVTGRHKVLMARYGYHGGLHEFESGSFGAGGPDTLMATYGDADSFCQVIEERGHEIAFWRACWVPAACSRHRRPSSGPCVQPRSAPEPCS
jgi:glutamate-1-semialdehyde 2,1-aminomutase